MAYFSRALQRSWRSLEGRRALFHTCVLSKAVSRLATRSSAEASTRGGSYHELQQALLDMLGQSVALQSYIAATRIALRA